MDKKTGIQNVIGTLTASLLHLLREMQAWYQGRYDHTDSLPEDHCLGGALARFAASCGRIGSIRLTTTLEPHRFARPNGIDLVDLTILMRGEYLSFLAHNKEKRLVAAGITHLVRDGKTLLRIDGCREKVFFRLNLHAMHTPLVEMSSLLKWINEEPAFEIPSGEAPERCFVDFRDELTLQTYAAVRRPGGVPCQPTIVEQTLEGIHRLMMATTPSVSITLATPFDIDVAAFLLGHEAERLRRPLITLFGRELDGPDLEEIRSSDPEFLNEPAETRRVLIASSSPAKARTLHEAVKHSLSYILANTERSPS